MNFSLEIGPKTDLDTLPNLKDIYITFLLINKINANDYIKFTLINNNY